MACLKPTNGRDCFSAPLVASILHLIKKQAFSLGILLKNWFILSAVRISSYGCTWEVWGAHKKLELISAFTLLSCSPNFPHVSITRYTQAKYETLIFKKQQETKGNSTHEPFLNPLAPRVNGGIS